MTSTKTILAILITLVSACDVGTDTGDSRLDLVEFECQDEECQGRWDGLDMWSPVFPAEELDGLEELDIASVFDCGLPDADICVIVDEQDHRGCFRLDDRFAVAVAPSCAASGSEWIDVGNDTVAWTYPI